MSKQTKNGKNVKRYRWYCGSYAAPLDMIKDLEFNHSLSS